jgi:uncharacterized repeat protein (TIGR01451 family)/LPXTG-motif cell wall-anchored protein
VALGFWTRLAKTSAVAAGLVALAPVVPGSFAIASASASEGAVTAATHVDKARLVVEVDDAGNPTSSPTLTYDVVITNGTGAAVSGVQMVDSLPAGAIHPQGSQVRFSVGDLAPGQSWRSTFTVDVDYRRAGARLSNGASAVLGDGTRVASAPAVTEIDVISSSAAKGPGGSSATPVPATTAPATAPAAPRVAPATVPRNRKVPAPRRRIVPVTPAGTHSRVLGVSFTPAEAAAEGQLPNTGGSTLVLAIAGIGLVAAGVSLLRAGDVIGVRPRDPAE